MATVYVSTNMQLVTQYFTSASHFKDTSLISREYTLVRPTNGTKIVNKYTGVCGVISDKVPFIITVAPDVYEPLSFAALCRQFVFADGSAITESTLLAKLKKQNNQVNIKYNTHMLCKRFEASYVPIPYTFTLISGVPNVNDSRIPSHGVDYIKGDVIVREKGTNNVSIVNGRVFYYKFNKQAFTANSVKQIKAAADKTLQTDFRYNY